MSESKCHVCGFAKPFIVHSKLHGMVTSDCQCYFPVHPEFKGCPACGYICVERDSPLETQELFRERYQFIQGEDDLEYMRFDSEIPTGVAGYLADLALEFIRPDPDFHYLDIGAGKGTLVQAVHSRQPEIGISAIEPSPAYETLSRRKCLQNHYHGFFRAEQFAEQTFDLITLIDVLEHVPDPLAFLQEIGQVMHENSYLLIEVPNFANNAFDVVTYDHLSKFVPDSLENLLTLAGFSVVKRWLPETVAMQMAVRKRSKDEPEVKLLPVDAGLILETAIGQFDFLLSKVHELLLKPVAFYGQSIVAPYLVGSGLISVERVKAMIDDNLMYQGQKWLQKVPIVALERFKNDCKAESQPPAILLTMNRCYHPRVAPKVSDMEVHGLCL